MLKLQHNKSNTWCQNIQCSTSNSLYCWQNEYWSCSRRSGDGLNGNFQNRPPCQPTLKQAPQQSPELGSHQQLEFWNKIMIVQCSTLGTNAFPYYLNFSHLAWGFPKCSWFRKKNKLQESENILTSLLQSWKVC